MKKNRLILIMILAAVCGIAGAKAKVTKPLCIPYSQFYKSTYELRSAYLPKNGEAVLSLQMKGSGSVVSVNVKSPEGKALAGMVTYDKGNLVLSKTMSFVELNCTDGGSGVALSPDAATSFDILLAPGQYTSLSIVVCDSDHRMMSICLPSVSLAANQVLTKEVSYTPSEGILWYEGFDTFVWGGDYAGGIKAPAFAPVPGFMTNEIAARTTGYEDACIPTSYNLQGCAYMQSEDYTMALADRVSRAKGNIMSEAYLRSRNLWDYGSLFRTAEFPGYIGVGNTGRGILRTDKIHSIRGIRSVKISFDLLVKAAFTNNIVFKVQNGGYITGVTVDNQTVDTDKKTICYDGTASQVILDSRYLRPAATAVEPKKWQHVEVLVDRATDGMDLVWMTEKLGTESHGFFVDNILIEDRGEMERGDLRVLYWNIQNGMWYDQEANYENFVKWVEKYDPDVCVWCEASTIYHTNSDKHMPKEELYLPANWDKLAQRYGHSHVAIGAHTDNYPQEVTSRYPIVTLKKIGKTEVPNPKVEGKTLNVAHGCGVQQIEVNGHVINIVTMHTWPQKYAWGLPDKEKATRDASAKEREGDRYREFEMRYVVEHTIKSPEFAGHEDWLLMGDMNSRSRNDAWHFNNNDDLMLACQDVVLNETDMVDIIPTFYPGDFMTSTYGNGRIDIMYASPSMYAHVKNAMILIDGWTSRFGNQRSPYVKSFNEPSDHRPILVDFVFQK